MHVPACSRLPKAHPRPRPCSHSSNLPCSPRSTLSQLQTLPAWPSMSNSNLLVGTTLPFVLPIHRVCPLATPKLWNWHCLGIEVTCWALSVGPSSPASPHAALTPGLQAVLPGTKNTLISALSSLLKLSPHALTVLPLSPAQVLGQLEPFLFRDPPGCPTTHWPLSLLSALYPTWTEPQSRL